MNLRNSTQEQRDEVRGSEAFQADSAVIGAFTSPGFIAFLDQSHAMTFIEHLKRHDCPVSSSEKHMHATGTMCQGGTHNENIDVVLKAMKSSHIPSDKWTFIWIGQTKRIPLMPITVSASTYSDDHILHKENLDIDFAALASDPFFIALDDLLTTTVMEDSSTCCVSFDLRVVCQGPQDSIPFISLNSKCHEYKGRQFALSTPLHYFTSVAQCILRNEPPSCLLEHMQLETPGSARLYLRGGGVLRTKMPLQSDILSSINAHLSTLIFLSAFYPV